MSLVQFLQIFIIAVANAVAQALLKMANLHGFGWNVFFNKFVWFGAILYVAAFGLWVKIVNEMELSLAVPIMTGIVYGLTIFFAWYFFKEQMSVIKAIGIFLILLGIVFLAKK